MEFKDMDVRRVGDGLTEMGFHCPERLVQNVDKLLTKLLSRKGRAAGTKKDITY